MDFSYEKYEPHAHKAHGDLDNRFSRHPGQSHANLNYRVPGSPEQITMHNALSSLRWTDALRLHDHEAGGCEGSSVGSCGQQRVEDRQRNSGGLAISDVLVYHGCGVLLS